MFSIGKSANSVGEVNMKAMENHELWGVPFEAIIANFQLAGHNFPSCYGKGHEKENQRQKYHNTQCRK